MVRNEPNERILLTGTAPDGDRIDLVGYGADRCGISVNGVPDPERQWCPFEPQGPTLALMRALGLD